MTAPKTSTKTEWVRYSDNSRYHGWHRVDQTIGMDTKARPHLRTVYSPCGLIICEEALHAFRSVDSPGQLPEHPDRYAGDDEYDLCPECLASWTAETL